MRWSYRGRSANLEDRRGMRMVPGGGLGLGIGGTLLLVLLSVIFKVDLLSLAGGGGEPTPAGGTTAPLTDEAEEPQVRFVSFVLDDAQNTWRQLFAREGREYRDAKLVLFREAVRSGCGTAPAAVGPFYCPADERVYIDLSFYDELQRRFGASGDFAQAYVLAHEVGHHVQTLLGAGPQPGTNAASVRMELQADCLAGVWGHSTRQREILERGDVEEGLNAASAIGDDRLQRMSRGEVNPDTFTHGSSAQRVEAFRRGLEQGTPAACRE